ncbi:hypothetical protein N0V93_008023 [Gnomoniopsis smithogilvyi]|uniref:Uncharacterized protein n=1 Tax=Gnomoniopsis smithogilvyi TaxID=1191159 RepID=A0A9W8YLW1_9PEZI|nr:hypothetical protein N0V93_008023 [Gnomoniopsis smithogilvyi]
MNSPVDTAFPLIPQPMALAANTLTGSARRANAPTCSSSSTTTTTSSGRSVSTDKLIVLKPRHWLFHEDVFSRLLSGPLIIVHFALYCAVPVYYLVHYSPFSHFEPGTLNQTIRWTLLFLTQCFTAVLAVAGLGKQYRVGKELIAFLSMGTAVFLLAGLKHVVEDMAAPKG